MRAVGSVAVTVISTTCMSKNTLLNTLRLTSHRDPGYGGTMLFHLSCAHLPRRAPSRLAARRLMSSAWLEGTHKPDWLLKKGDAYWMARLYMQVSRLDAPTISSFECSGAHFIDNKRLATKCISLFRISLRRSSRMLETCHAVGRNVIYHITSPTL